MHLPRPRITRHDFVDHQQESDRVLVVIFLRGGADGLTLVPPVGDDAYHRARPLLAVERSDAIDLNGYFGLNQSLSPLMRYFEAGDLAIVHGAGSEDDSRSHFLAQDTMEHGGIESGSGWLARYLRASRQSPSALSAVAIGTTRPESLRGAPAGAVMQTVAEFGLQSADPQLLELLSRWYATEAGPLGAAAQDTLEAVRKLRELRATGAPPGLGAKYPDSSFGRGLREIARLIKAEVGLRATTIDLQGWDTHFVQSRSINGLMRNLATGIDAFLTDLGPARRRTTAVVMTEFGRRLKENSSFGTDHGAGSVMMVIGDGAADRLAGGRLTSVWSDLSKDQLDAVGDIPVGVDYRDVLGPVLRWASPGVDVGRVF